MSDGGRDSRLDQECAISLFVDVLDLSLCPLCVVGLECLMDAAPDHDRQLWSRSGRLVLDSG
jgi:hypothetical protein